MENNQSPQMSTHGRSAVLRPAGTFDNSPVIHRWETESRHGVPVPEGRLNGSIVPPGRPNGQAIGNPAMNRWATITRPSGATAASMPCLENA
jgi:hypothetical protein